MFIHLGSGVIVRSEGLVGIFDIEKTTSTHRTREFLTARQKAGQIVTVGDDIPKSFAVFSGKDSEKTYITQLSPATLKKRAAAGFTDKEKP